MVFWVTATTGCWWARLPGTLEGIGLTRNSYGTYMIAYNIKKLELMQVLDNREYLIILQVSSYTLHSG